MPVTASRGLAVVAAASVLAAASVFAFVAFQSPSTVLSFAKVADAAAPVSLTMSQKAPSWHLGQYSTSGAEPPSPEQIKALHQPNKFAKNEYFAVSYGPHPSQVLNFWESGGAGQTSAGKVRDAALATGPRPLVVNIHGGGWLQQDYRQNPPVTQLLAAGVSYAVIEYRRVCDTDRVPADDHRSDDCAPLPAPVMDAARAVKFLKSKAEEWNIDPDRIILKGNSAGGCTAFYLNYHKDLADKDAEDPIERQSTKVLAAVVNSGQSSIDPEQLLSGEWGFGEIKKDGNSALAHFMMMDSVGPIAESGPTEEQLALYKEFSPINHVRKSSPPVYMIYDSAAAPIHSAQFGIKMKQKVDKVGGEAFIEIKGAPEQSQLTSHGHTYTGEIDFMLDKFGLIETRQAIKDKSLAEAEKKHAK